VPGSLCVAADGTVYATDSAHPAIYRVRGLGEGALEEWVRDPLFRSLQGLALSADGRTLWVADYAHGLLAVEVASRAVRAVAPPPGASALGIDGLARHGADLVAVQNGVVPPRVVRLVLAPDGSRIRAIETLDRNLALADEPTLGVVVGDEFDYVANSAWEKFDDTGRPRPGAVPTAPVVLRLPLAPAGR
jgi:hypothetical protein